MKKYTLQIIQVVASIGLIDALYLSYSRYTGINLPCSITDGGCAVVAASPYAVLFGMPLAYLGVLFYIAILILTCLYKYFKTDIFKHILIGAIVFGALDSLYFLYIQGFVIGAFCIYCIISAIATFILLAPAYSLYQNKYNNYAYEKTKK